jgi:hypothetical protein|tara:strand:- start:122 stop:316 length:195 start_codon:yes stop_codon:yes gene_type:complete
MNNYTAIAYIEGIEEADDEQQIAAWQYLIDTGTVWALQGWYGRGAVHLISAGYCTMPAQEEATQ